MNALKNVLWTIAILAMFVCGAWALFICVADTENIRLVKKIEQTKVGQHVDLAGHGFLKTRGQR